MDDWQIKYQGPGSVCMALVQLQLLQTKLMGLRTRKKTS